MYMFSSAFISFYFILSVFLSIYVSRLKMATMLIAHGLFYGWGTVSDKILKGGGGSSIGNTPFKHPKHDLM